MSMILAIASGGAIGAVLRYLMESISVFGMDFPVGTLIVNVLGSFAMGALVTFFALYYTPSPELRAFLAVGLLGAFTTFSTFSLDVVTLWDRGDIYHAIGYGLASLILSVGGLVLGMILVRQILT